MPKSIDTSIKKLVEKIKKLEKENEGIKKILKSAAPLKCVYKENELSPWDRHYHTEDGFIEEHISKHGFTLDIKDDNIGFLLKVNPNELFK